jgi:hypothetical protein
MGLAALVPSLAVAAPGDVLRSWFTPGVSGPWGLGYTGGVGSTGTLWISDVPFEDNNHEFTADGVPTGRVWNANWGGAWPADMTYLPSLGLLCQVNVRGDNGIHCWDPDTGTDPTATDEHEHTIKGQFPWTAASQRGLAYRADDDTFYIGGWEQKIIYRIKGFSYIKEEQGAVIETCTLPDLNIAGLAYNAAFGVLWIATNSATDTIYKVSSQLNPKNEPNPRCVVRENASGEPDTLPHPDPGFNGGGLEMDENGNLWIVSQNGGAVYLVDSGLPAMAPPPPGALLIADVVRRVPGRAFKSLGLRRSLEARLDAIQDAINDRRFGPAAAMLRNLRTRVDGCGATADRDDWIAECEWQFAVRSAIDALIGP